MDTRNKPLDRPQAVSTLPTINPLNLTGLGVEMWMAKFDAEPLANFRQTLGNPCQA